MFRHQTSVFRHQKIIFLLIILLAVFLRFNQLGSNPPALDWDEASLGYNAYSILKTGKDEYGRFLPVSIRSFGDYKPALYTYLTIPSIYLFGLNEFSVRFPSAVIGSITVFITYLLVKKILSQKIALASALFLAISPWHLQFSRVAFEANIGVFLIVLGVYLFIKGLEKGIYIIFSAFIFSLSFYAYHAPRLIVPLLLIGWSIFFFKKLWMMKKYVIISIITALIILIPFIREFTQAGGARLASVTVLTPQGRLENSIVRTKNDISQGDYFGKFIHNRRIVYSLSVLKGYLDHFNLEFLFLKGDDPGRHHAQDMGMLYFWDFIFVILGIFYLLKSRTKYKFPLFWWFLVAPTASAITTGTPHAVRSLTYLPIYQIFIALGLICVYKMFKCKQNYIKYISIFSIYILLFINVFYYLQMYYVHTPIESAQDWQYGYKQAVEIVSKYEASVDKIIITYKYDQPYIYVLFYELINPSWYQNQYTGGEIQRSFRTFGKYEFRSIDWENDSKRTKTLFIGTPAEIPETASGIVDTIYYPNGGIAFRIVKS